MKDGAQVKKHIRELNELLLKRRPFALVVQTDTKTNERFLFVKKDQAVIDEVALRCGDVIHNLRAALDHAYWEIISPHCMSDQERRRIQFPFARRSDGYMEALKNRCAFKGGTGFVAAILGLRAYGESGGNELLCLAEELDVLDKHKLLIPAVHYAKIPRQRFMELLPDWPQDAQFGSIVMTSGFTGRLKWSARVPRTQLGVLVPPSTSLYERDLNVPGEIVLKEGSPEAERPMIETLNGMGDVVREFIDSMRKGAASY